jgi:hypothetical protein
MGANRPRLYESASCADEGIGERTWLMLRRKAPTKDTTRSNQASRPDLGAVYARMDRLMWAGDTNVADQTMRWATRPHVIRFLQRSTRSNHGRRQTHVNFPSRDARTRQRLHLPQEHRRHMTSAEEAAKQPWVADISRRLWRCCSCVQAPDRRLGDWTHLRAELVLAALETFHRSAPANRRRPAQRPRHAIQLWHLAAAVRKPK